MSLARRHITLLAASLVGLACARGREPSGFGGASSEPAVATSIAAIGSSLDASETAEAADSGAADGSGGATDTGSTGAGSEADQCAAIFEVASEQLPADIILVVDNSGSMQVEAASVKANLNEFSSKIIASGVDVRVVLLSALGGKNGMCIDPPLGSGGCPDDDSKLPTFLHINKSIGSNNALQRLLDTHALWQPQMRAGARKHIVIVSDDNSKLGAAAFDAAFKALDPTHDPYVLHAIVGEKDASDAVWCKSEPVCCKLTAAAGTVYLDLIALTGGIHGDLCQQDFTQVFDVLSSEVIQDSGLPCAWPIPEPAEGQTLDLDQVEIEFDDGMGTELSIPRIAGVAACADVSDGWYYNDLEPPTTLQVCPQTCTRMQLAPKGSLRIEFACEPVLPQ